MEVTAIWLRREGDWVILAFEDQNGTWRRAAHDYADGLFSHIVELNHTGNGDNYGKPRPLTDFPVDEL